MILVKIDAGECLCGLERALSLQLGETQSESSMPWPRMSGRNKRVSLVMVSFVAVDAYARFFDVFLTDPHSCHFETSRSTAPHFILKLFFLWDSSTLSSMARKET